MLFPAKTLDGPESIQKRTFALTADGHRSALIGPPFRNMQALLRSRSRSSPPADFSPNQPARTEGAEAFL